MKIQKIITLLSLAALIVIIGFVILQKGKKQEEGEISLKEEQQIEVWITENNLNPYGDPKDTFYIGGTPLFNERTGQSIDKYQYILERHLDKPWLK